MLLRKQTSYSQCFHTSLAFQPSIPGYQAGIVLWWSQFSYATVGVAATKLENGDVVRSIAIRRPIGKAGAFEVREHCCPATMGDHTLKLLPGLIVRHWKTGRGSV